jgi:uncharacterized protein (UPF0297 family)
LTDRRLYPVGIYITSLIIVDEVGNQVSAMIAIERNSTRQFSVSVNEGASTAEIIWTISNSIFASVDNSGYVSTNNVVGIVTLSARDPVTNISHSIALRIS